MLAIVQNPRPGGRTKYDQRGVRRLISKGLAIPMTTVNDLILSIRLVEPLEDQLRCYQTQRGYDENVSKVKVTRREAKRVPFAGNVEKLRLER